jgi:hypothetical protein
MVINFKVCGISRDALKLTRTLMLIQNKIYVDNITSRYNIKAIRSNYILIKKYIIFLNYFYVLISKINFKNKKSHYILIKKYNIF